MAKKPSQRKDAPSPQKARQILRDGTAQGQPLTRKQQGFFGAIRREDAQEVTPP